MVLVLSLFEDVEKKAKLTHIVDTVNNRYAKICLIPGVMIGNE
jgi:hypothetical protein